MLQMWRERQMPVLLKDTTPDVSKHSADEIQQWLAGCGEPCNYVIIDDLEAEILDDDPLDKLVIVNPHHGLDKESAEQAMPILKRQIDIEY